MKKQVLNFTKKSLEALEPPAQGYQDYQDEQNKYFRLRITKHDTRSFYLVRRVKGRTFFKKLGVFPELTVAQVRARCNEERLKLTNGEIHKRAHPLTFSQLFDRYMEEHAKPHKRTWQEDQRQYDRYLQSFYDLVAGNIDRESVNKFHKYIGEKHGPCIVLPQLELDSCV